MQIFLLYLKLITWTRPWDKYPINQILYKEKWVFLNGLVAITVEPPWFDDLSATAIIYNSLFWIPKAHILFYLPVVATSKHLQF